MSLRDQILNANDIVANLLPLPIPEWGVTLFLRVMPGRQRERFEYRYEKGNDPTLRAFFATLVACDEQGTPLFTDADVAGLAEKSSRALDRIYQAGIKLNAIGKAGVDELEKNSGAATSGATPTASPLATESPTSTGS
jgi:hypothetical protein